MQSVPALSHTLRGCVDWNTGTVRVNQSEESHTLRGCVDWNSRSTVISPEKWSHTLRGCVDWNWLWTWFCDSRIGVTPCVGVWIETGKKISNRIAAESHPAWVCGLKPYNRTLSKYEEGHTLRGCVDWNWHHIYPLSPVLVTPCVGVWIETITSINPVICSWVTPCVGVWIETGSYCITKPWRLCHTLRGCVDWNLFGIYLLRNLIVTPCVGVWIETSLYHVSALTTSVTPCVGVWIETLPLGHGTQPTCHTLRGCVDWNLFGIYLLRNLIVTPCVGVWIETHNESWTFSGE